MKSWSAHLSSALVPAWTCLAKPSSVLFSPQFYFITVKMDIFNRPPSISEDTVHYTIYTPLDSSDKISVTALAASISNHVNTMLPNFVWHRDAFEIKLIKDQDNTESWILEGRMRVGDSVDDEWCTVWLLKEISSKWDVAIRHVIFLGLPAHRYIQRPILDLVFMILMVNSS